MMNTGSLLSGLINAQNPLNMTHKNAFKVGLGKNTPQSNLLLNQENKPKVTHAAAKFPANFLEESANAYQNLAAYQDLNLQPLTTPLEEPLTQELQSQGNNLPASGKLLPTDNAYLPPKAQKKIAAKTQISRQNQATMFPQPLDIHIMISYPDDKAIPQKEGTVQPSVLEPININETHQSITSHKPSLFANEAIDDNVIISQTPPNKDLPMAQNPKNSDNRLVSAAINQSFVDDEPLEGQEGAVSKPATIAELSNNQATHSHTVEGQKITTEPANANLPTNFASPVNAWQNDRLFDNHAVNNAAPLDFTDNHFGEHLGEKVLLFTKDNINNASLDLNPANLGPLHVKLQVHDGQTRIFFTSHEAQVRETLENFTPKLKEMFEHAGLNLTDVNVSSRDPREFNQQASQQATEPGQLSAQAQPSINPLEAGVTRYRPNGLVDYYI